jgi:hypothetical protein
MQNSSVHLSELHIENVTAVALFYISFQNTTMLIYIYMCVCVCVPIIVTTKILQANGSNKTHQLAKRHECDQTNDLYLLFTKLIEY